MLNFTGALKVFVAVQPADLRKSFSGLYALTANVLNERPDSGGLFVFTNQRRNRVKALYLGRGVAPNGRMTNGMPIK